MATSGDTSADVLVIGGGISGLTTAFTIAEASKLRVAIAEAGAQWGGSIVSQSNEAGFLWELGPNSFSPNAALLELVERVGLSPRLIWADAKLPRFVFWGDRLHAVPSSPPALLKSELLSLSGKLRAIRGAMGFVAPAMTENESVASFFRRHLGQEVVERLVAPFVSGVYAGDPEQLGVSAAFSKVFQLEREYGGLLAGFLLSQSKTPKSSPQIKLGQLGSFQGGLQVLPQAIAQKLSQISPRLYLQWRCQHLSYSAASQTYTAQFATPDGIEAIQSRSVVLAIPAYACAEMLRHLSPVASEILASIAYPPVACVALAYPEASLRFPLKGFGNLIPRGQGIRTLGTIWASSLFPNRAPQSWQLLLNFIGGATDPQIAHLSAEEIVQAVDQDLRQILLQPDTASAPQVLAVKLWHKAIPQYGLDHVQKMQSLQQAIARLPNLYLCGNYSDGVALGDCVRRGMDLGKKLAQLK
jgi:oxygen-dependent protoporphyrinogen oxidase